MEDINVHNGIQTDRDALMPVCNETGVKMAVHVRRLWNEAPGKVRPGCGLCDRALGIQYMLGVWDTLDRLEGKG